MIMYLAFLAPFCGWCVFLVFLGNCAKVTWCWGVSRTAATEVQRCLITTFLTVLIISVRLNLSLHNWSNIFFLYLSSCTSAQQPNREKSFVKEKEEMPISSLSRPQYNAPSRHVVLWVRHVALFARLKTLTLLVLLLSVEVDEAGWK